MKTAVTRVIFDFMHAGHYLHQNVQIYVLGSVSSFNIYGQTDPIQLCTVTAFGIGPWVTVEPYVLQWDDAMVNVPSTKQIYLRNVCPIPATWSIEIVSRPPVVIFWIFFSRFYRAICRFCEGISKYPTINRFDLLQEMNYGGGLCQDPTPWSLSETGGSWPRGWAAGGRDGLHARRQKCQSHPNIQRQGFDVDKS